MEGKKKEKGGEGVDATVPRFQLLELGFEPSPKRRGGGAWRRGGGGEEGERRKVIFRQLISINSPHCLHRSIGTSGPLLSPNVELEGGKVDRKRRKGKVGIQTFVRSARRLPELKDLEAGGRTWGKRKGEGGKKEGPPFALVI